MTPDALALMEPTDWTASEISGPLARTTELAAYDAAGLVALARSYVENTRAIFDDLCAICTEVAARAGERPADRNRALREFAEATDLRYRDVVRMVRVARVIPPEVMAQNPQASPGLVAFVAERSAGEGQTLAQRQAVAQETLEAAVDNNWTFRQVEEHLAARVGKPARPDAEDEFLRILLNDPSIAVAVWKDTGLSLDACNVAQERLRAELLRRLKLAAEAGLGVVWRS